MKHAPPRLSVSDRDGIPQRPRFANSRQPSLIHYQQLQFMIVRLEVIGHKAPEAKVSGC